MTEQERTAKIAERKRKFACKALIEESIREHYDGMRLNRAALESVMKEYDVQEIAWMLSVTLHRFDYDGRFSPSNKEWARRNPVSPDVNAWGEDRNEEFAVTTHPAILNGFITQFLEEIYTA